MHLTPLPTTGTGAKIPEIKTKRAELPVNQISKEGVITPRWRDAQSIEFGSSNRYQVYHLETKKTDTTPLDLRVQQENPAGSIAFTNVRLITMDGDKTIERGTIVVQGARIRCIGTCDTSGVDRVMDLQDKTIIPGLIDMHAHHHEFHSGIVPQHDYQSATYLAYGVTTTLDPAVVGENAFTVSELIRANRVIGPRTFTTAEPIEATNGSGESLLYSDLDTYETTENEIARRMSLGAVSLKSYMQPRREQRQWITDIARNKGIRVTGESGSLEFTMSLVMDGQAGWEHDLLWPPFYKDVIEFFGRSGATYSPTFNVSTPGPWNEEFFYQESELWKDEKLRKFTPWRALFPHSRRHMWRPVDDYGFALFAQGLADIMQAGGNGAIGSHGQQHGIGSHWELWMAASVLKPQQALEVATIGGARFLGADQDLGSLSTGKLADLIVLNSNPLENIRNSTDILYVMKGGILYDDETLDEIWPQQRPYGMYPWQNDDAVRSDDRPADYWDKQQ
ncbi:MAG TPA: amidohydrolase family protein [Acidobacteriota bacterium]|nr:amidohydrolase family protein [Acidobacteriota bacterium]